MGPGPEQPAVADPALRGGVGLGDPQRSLPTSAMLGFLGFGKMRSTFLPALYFRGLAIYPNAWKAICSPEKSDPLEQQEMGRVGFSFYRK